MAERERQGIKTGPQKKTGCQVSFAKTTEKELAATKRKLKKANCKISSLQTKGDSESDNSTSGGEPSNNGGNSFGGREEKRKERRARRIDSLSVLCCWRIRRSYLLLYFRLETSDWIDFNEEREQERRICDFITTDRQDGPERKILATSREDQHKVHHGRIKLDSHADAIVFGKNCVGLAFNGRECDVSPYTDTYDSIKSVPIAKAGTAWTSPESGTTFILVFKEGLWMGDKMEHTLVNPNQMRLFGITVQDNPVCESPLYLTTEDGDFVLSLQMKDTDVMANTRTPTAQALHDCTLIVLSSEHPWDPHRVRFPEASRTVQEEIEMQRLIGGVRESRVGLSWEEPTKEKLSEAEIFNMDGILSRLISSVKISKVSGA